MSVWHYEASLGLVGERTDDGRVLLPPQRGEARQWVAPYPLPVMGFQRVSRAGDGQGGPDTYRGPEPVALIETVELRGRELMATGRFGDTVLGWHYAGALAVDAVWLGIDVDRTIPEPMYRATLFTGWRIRAATLVEPCPWPREKLTPPRVWHEPGALPG